MAMAELHLTDDASLRLVPRTSVLWVRVTD
jgi:hypothetical protein